MIKHSKSVYEHGNMHFQTCEDLPIFSSATGTFLFLCFTQLVIIVRSFEVYFS